MCNEIIQELNDHDRAEILDDLRRPQEWFVLAPRHFPTMTGSFVYHDEGDIVDDLDPAAAAWLMGLGFIAPIDPSDWKPGVDGVPEGAV